MIHQYIVCYLPGTSGKFVSSVLWKMLNDDGKEIQYTEHNSAHIETPWWENREEVESAPLDLTLFKWLELKDTDISLTHVYPDFDEIRNRLLTAKVILISPRHEDTLEVTHNWIYKNNNDPDIWYDIVHKGLVRGSVNPKDSQMFIYDFYNPSVPEDLKDRVFVVKYADLYEQNEDGSFKFLNFLHDLTKQPITDTVYASYKKYVDNRNKLWNK